MNPVTYILIASAIGVGGIVVGYFLKVLLTLAQKGSMENKIKQSFLDAKDQAQKIVSDAETTADKIITEAKSKLEEKESQLKKTEDRLVKKDELLDKRQMDIDKEGDDLKKQAEEIKRTKEKLDEAEKEKIKELQKIAGLSLEEAKEELMTNIEKQYEEDLLVRIKKLENEAGEKYEQKSKEILSTVIQRLSTSTVPEVMSTTVDIPSDDIKGKIIGKEGRNIRAFEKAT
ncbi:MAG TPA: Rnase Y domain-containing protein, partial [Candidatus Paceibacterota bacterium]|nr:Rnase Y domain-containing protein [Candidatus Paceibacterota bacterium]